MKQNILAQGIMQANSAELRTIYALLVETKLTTILTAKAKELFKKDIDHFNELLQKEIHKLDHFTDDELRLKLFLYFTKVLELKSADYTNTLDIETKSSEIILHIHELMLKNKDYEQFVIYAPETTIEKLLVQYQMQNIFSTFDKQFQQLNKEEALIFTATITDFLITLPPNQQQAVQQQFQLNELSAQAVHQALFSYGTVAVLSHIVEIAGFSAYTGLVSAIATSSAVAGLTLPIGIYTGATSLLFIVTNPLFLVTLAIGGGGLLFYHQNKKLRQSLLPVGILQLLLPVMLDNKQDIDYLPLIQEWQKKIELQHFYNKKSQITHEAYELQKATVVSLNTKAANNTGKIKAFYKDIQTIKLQLDEQLSKLKEDEKSSHFHQLSEQIEALQTEIQQLQTSIAKPKVKAGLLKSISGYFDNNALKSKITQLQQQRNDLIQQRVDAIIEMAPQAFSTELSTLGQAIEQIEALQKDNITLEKEKSLAKKQIEELKNTIFELDTVTKKLQKEYHGLNEMKLL